MIIRQRRPPVTRQTETQTRKNKHNPSPRPYTTRQPDHTPLLHSTIQTLIGRVILLLFIMNLPTVSATRMSNAKDTEPTATFQTPDTRPSRPPIERRTGANTDRVM